MESLLVAARAVHFMAAIALVGVFAFDALAIGGVPGGGSPIAPRAAAWPRLARTAGAWLALALLSGALWFVLEAAVMSGLPLAQAADRETLSTVAAQTLFGRVWCARLVIALVLGVVLAGSSRRDDAARSLRLLALALAAVFLAAIAWTGHANAEQGGMRLVHRAADALHLLAAGAWLGALPPLALRLGASRSAQLGAGEVDAIALVVQRFSVLGMGAVAVVLASGVINALFTVGSVAALADSSYGRLLVVKLAGVGAMLLLAALNRWRYTPVLADDKASIEARVAAARRLRRSAWGELALGLFVLAVVGLLGISEPAMGR